jgi:enoyl-CoA hydratase/carnithine racemase
MTETFADGRLQLAPGRISRLSLASPATRNAMSRAMWEALPSICDRVAADPSIRVLVVSGEGGTFCAGADISEFEDTYRTPESTKAVNAAVRAAQARLRALPKPTIAAIEGSCMGGGCGIALACDLRVAAEGARFAITPAKLGIAYSPADTRQLISAVGEAVAREMLLTARVLEAEEALRVGLVGRLVAPDQLEGEVAGLAEQMAALSPASQAATKAILNALSDPPPRSDLEGRFEALFQGDDFREGTCAFLEKRRPRF